MILEVQQLAMYYLKCSSIAWWTVSNIFHQWRCRRSYGVPAAAGRQQQQQRGWGLPGARASSDNFRGVGIGNAAAASTSDDWCEVCLVAPRAGLLASHWCRADMRGSENLVLCAICVLWMRDAPFVVRILLWWLAFFLYDRLYRCTLATFCHIQPNYY